MIFLGLSKCFVKLFFDYIKKLIQDKKENVGTMRYENASFLF